MNEKLEDSKLLTRKLHFAEELFPHRSKALSHTSGMKEFFDLSVEMP